MKTILVIFGGRSTEHDVSVISALASAVKPLELTGKYQVEVLYIAKNGAWYWGDEFKDVELYRSGRVDSFIKKQAAVSVKLDGGLCLVKSGKFGKRISQRIDIVFPVMHGSYGEDGSLMGLLEMAGVPYVGCGVAASALAMDKVLAKQVAQANGVNIPVGNYEYLFADTFVSKPDTVVAELEQSLRYPMFVKPARLGSSIGISRVTSKKELVQALEVACHYDSKVIVEEEVANLVEVTLPIIGNQELTFGYLEQPLLSGNDFFDFDTKYMLGGKKGKTTVSGKSGAQGYSKIPADLPKTLYAEAERVGAAVYRALGCSGIARIDMLVDTKAQKVYFNEVNPMPGSLYSHNWRAKGMSAVALVEKLVSLAEERFAAHQNIQTSFSTNYLKLF